eukprot:Gb_17038 [translate_table: standard]
MTIPTLSSPRRLARRDICVYSPGSNCLNDLPSNFLTMWKATVLAGAFTPIANVSVENNTLMTPRQKSISMTSFTIGHRPAWCTPIPLRNKDCTHTTCGSCRSDPFKR